jgi:hypothetical protein
MGQTLEGACRECVGPMHVHLEGARGILRVPVRQARRRGCIPGIGVPGMRVRARAYKDRAYLNARAQAWRVGIQHVRKRGSPACN